VPGLLGTKAGFRRRFANPIERDRDESAIAQLGSVIAPFVLRRTKGDPSIAPDLPPRTEIDHVVPLSTEQIALYRGMTADILQQIEDAEGIRRRGLVLKLLTALKQICDHPVLWLDQEGPLAARSGKLGAFDDLVTEMVRSGDAVLVFTQYVTMGHLLTERLGQLDISSQFLHGGTNATTRQAMVDRFQDGSGPPVFIISIKAGGTGLNLTRANQVIHYDRWWNPAVENQASDRAWRIGQKRAVFVHRLTSEGTLEESIAAELERKASLADSVIGSGEGWLSELDDSTLRSLVELSGSD
jgi:SNF2 family DNA or RNA helicase